VPANVNGKTLTATLDYQAGSLAVENVPLKLEF